MARGFVVVLAFAATAQAQEVSKAAKGTHPVAEQRGKQAAPPAARPAPEPRSGPLSRRADSPDRGGNAKSAAGERPSDRRTDCSGVESLLGVEVPAVRTYQPPSLAPTETARNQREVPAYVAAVMRCDHLYIFQIWAKSKSPWEIAQARLEAPNGEMLQVTAFHFKPMDRGDWDINVVVAEAPPGVEVPKLKLNLTSTDGRAAQLEATELP